MGWLRFWIRCLAQSFRPTFDWADLLPAVIAAITAAFGYEIASHLPWWATTLLLIATLWLARAIFVAPYRLYRSAVDEGERAKSRLGEIEAAYNWSGENLMSVREAMDLIIQRLSHEWPVSFSDEKKRSLAAAKLRELGHENQIPLWGFEAIDPPEIFKDHRVRIPPEFWVKNHIEPDYVYGRESTCLEPVQHTEEDGVLDPTVQPVYGDLRINRTQFHLAFPARQ